MGSCCLSETLAKESLLGLEGRESRDVAWPALGAAFTSSLPPLTQEVLGRPRPGRPPCFVPAWPLPPTPPHPLGIRFA